ncbi:MAG: hypothetical protein ACXVX4_04800 [Mycobacterium sp.]
MVASFAITRIESDAQVDGEAAGALETGGTRFSGLPFVSRTGAGLMPEPTFANPDPTLPVSTPTAPVSTPTVPNPAPTVPVSAPTAPTAALPGAANAASTLLGAGAAPLSSLGSLAQGGSAGGAAGPGLASSLTEQQDEDKRDDSGNQQPCQNLV